MVAKFAISLFISLLLILSSMPQATAGDQFEQIDANLLQWMQKFKVPGAQLSVAKNGKIIYSKGYGVADTEKHPVTSQNLFRVASVSKVFTAVAIWQLVEHGKLKLDDKAFVVLDNLKGPSGSTEDPRLRTVSILNLLDHTGGWDISVHGDSQVIYTRLAADTFKEPRPATPTTIVRFMRGQPLQFDPGTKYVYSNFGFNVLGRLIEKASGTTYEEYIKEHVLKPAGVTDMRIAKSRLTERFPNEVMYFDGDDEPLVWSVLDNEPGQVKWSYGGDFAIETMDAHGGWLATADDLAKVAAAVNGTDAVISKSTLKQMLAIGPNRESTHPGTFYGHGVLVNPSKDRWSHTGALHSGTGSVLYSLRNGVTIGATFNHLDINDLGGYFGGIENAVIKPVDSMGL